jgi:hypothetical protein|eukprot:COSAG02_NODE_11661_length_1678_cov_8.287001_2_plen_87_part_00
MPDPRVGYQYYVQGRLAPGEKYYNCSAGKDHYPTTEYRSEAECEAHPPPLPKPLMGENQKPVSYFRSKEIPLLRLAPGTIDKSCWL